MIQEYIKQKEAHKREKEAEFEKLEQSDNPWAKYCEKRPVKVVESRLQDESLLDFEDKEEVKFNCQVFKENLLLEPIKIKIVFGEPCTLIL